MDLPLTKVQFFPIETNLNQQIPRRLRQGLCFVLPIGRIWSFRTHLQRTQCWWWWLEQLVNASALHSVLQKQVGAAACGQSRFQFLPRSQSVPGGQKHDGLGSQMLVRVLRFQMFHSQHPGRSQALPTSLERTLWGLLLYLGLLFFF